MWTYNVQSDIIHLINFREDEIMGLLLALFLILGCIYFCKNMNR